MKKRKIDRNWVEQQVRDYTAVLPRYVEYSDILNKILKLESERIAPMSIIQLRTKTIPSFIGKAIRKADYRRNPVQEFTDLTGARIIVQTRDYIEPVCNFIKDFFDIDWDNSLDVTERLKSTEFGYRSIHYIVSLKPDMASRLYSNVKIPDSAYPDDSTPMKAEIQIKTVLEHCWAQYSHDLSYKGSFKLPDFIERELAVVSALLESADSSLIRINDRIKGYTASYGSYLTESEIRDEIALNEIILEYAPDQFQNAYKIGKLAKSIADWEKMIEVLSGFIDYNYPPILRDLGIALCQKYKADTNSVEFKQGQKYLKASIQLDSSDIDAISSYAGTWKNIDPQMAHKLYKKAFEIDDGDPYVLGNCLEYEIKSRGDDSIISLMSQPLERAINRCREQAEVGTNYPWAYYDMGKFYLLADKPYMAMLAYLNAIKVSSAPFMVETSKRSLENIKPAIGKYFDWANELLEIGCHLIADSEESCDDFQKSTSKEDCDIKDSVVIVAGSCDSMSEFMVDMYQERLTDAFRDFHGTIISGGTDSGISGIVGSLQEKFKSKINTIGYVPSELPTGAKIDERYSQIRRTPGYEFNPLQIIMYWRDIITSGIDPKTVKFICINGKLLSVFEFMFACVMGAKVITLQKPSSDSNVADDNVLLSYLNEIEVFPHHKYVLRSFIGIGTEKLPVDVREKLAIHIHNRYRATYPPQLVINPESMVEWEDLSEEYRESNRENVDNILQKLNEIG
ncbi:MAG: RelA/SpoT domain-containing protein, partial [bacterium]